MIGWQLALYLQHLAESVGSMSAVEDAVNAIAPSRICVSGHTGANHTMHSCRIEESTFQTQAEKGAIQMLTELAEAVAEPISLSDSRMLTMALLSFAGFLRFNEVANLKCNEVQVHPEYVELQISKSKTDQYRDGASVVIARSGNSRVICPVARLEEYIRLAKIDLQSDERLFRAIMKTKAGEKLRRTGTISYTRIREIVLNNWVMTHLDSDFIASVRVVPLQRLTLGYWTGFSNAM